MSLINNIQNALNTRLATVSGLPTVYYPNVESTPTQGTSWVRPTLLPANSDTFTLNGQNQHQGIYQVDVFTQIKKGTAPLWLIADAIRDNFNTNKKITSGSDVINIQAISFSTAQRVESWWSCYVQINYICFN